jgi:hypothetical protein
MGFSMLLSAQFAFAVDVGDQGIISQLQKVREQLRQSAGASADCKTPDAANCNFQDYCQQFTGKGKEFYLYQNAEGRQVSNTQLINHLESAQTCLGKSFPQPPVRDPFVYPEQFTDPAKAGGTEKIRENLARYEQESKRVATIFSDVQSRMVRLLESRRTKANSDSIDNMLARVKAVKIFTPEGGLKPQELALYGCDIPNAGYNPSEHKIIVCPQLMNLPDSALFSILTHELTHPIDPCQMSMAYVRYHGIISQYDTDLTNPEPQPKDAFFKSIKAAANPFKSIIACLQKPESMGVKIPSEENLITQLRTEAENALGLKEEIADSDGNPQGDATDMLRAALEERAEGIHKNYNEFKQCYNMTGSGHATEAFADWMSSQLLKQKVADIPDSGKAKDYAAESQMFFMAASCQNLNQAATAAVRPLIKNKCGSLLSEMEAQGRTVSTETDTHPDTGKRVSRILYAPAEIQKALGCKKTAGLIECQ